MIDNIKFVKSSKEKMGLEYENSKPIFLLPQCFRESKLDRDTYKDIVLFLKSFELFRKEDLEENQAYDFDDSDSSWPIESYLWIIKDYLENGYYYNREKHYSNDMKGRISWKKTLKTQPIYSNGNIIYDKLVTSHLKDHNDIITHIYKFCLRQSIDKMGWYFNINHGIAVNKMVTITEMINIVNKEQHNTFDDIKRLRFKHMLYILKFVSSSNDMTKYKSYTVPVYDGIFERMVDQFLLGMDEKEKRQFYGKATWHLNNKKAKSSTALPPDTIFKKEVDTVFLFDSKMYQFGSTGDINDLPTSPDIRKQVDYGDYAYYVATNQGKIRNAFILPYNKENYNKEIRKVAQPMVDSTFAYIGVANVPWRDKNNHLDHEDVYTFLVDFNTLLREYKSKEMHYVLDLCDSIEELIENKK